MEKRINTTPITSYMVKNKICKTQFCKLCKISLRTYNKIMSNDLDYGISILLRIAKVIDVPILNFFIF